jgi:hypothetical protein
MRSSRSTAPTDRAASAVLGEETRSAPGPPAGSPFPAAATNSVPCSSVSALIDCSIGSISGPSAPPRLRFTTRAPLSAAHSMPAMSQDSKQPI